MRRHLACLLVALPLCASPAAAQSLFGSSGLGVVSTPTDARGTALGGVGVALPRPGAALANPADAIATERRGLIVAFQPTSTELETGLGSDGVAATRFPVVQMLLPIRGRAVFSAGFGAFLDQNWGVRTTSTQEIAGDTIDITDRVVSSGGISQARVGLAYSITDDLAVGAHVGVLTGSTLRTTSRAFGANSVGLAPFSEDLKTSYAAPLASLGARYRIGSLVLVGASATWIGDLTVEVDDSTESEVAMPLQLAAGASAQLLDDLLVAVGTRWTGWSDLGSFDGATAEDVLEVGGGVEWSGISIARRVVPLRVGGRWGGQPFQFEGSSVSEYALSAGIGARLAGSEEIPAALVDFAIERGARGDVDENGIGESFWRATVSVSLFSQ
ncbi:MAG TPA: hypothetical protein VF039_11295 [Longimicrobiales bacterium]